MSHTTVTILSPQQATELDQLVSRLALEYPQHKLSIGYVGNAGRCGRSFVDDRDWHIFTTYRSASPGGHGHSISLSLPAYECLLPGVKLETLAPHTFEKVKERVEVFVRKLQDRANEGNIVTH